MSDTELKARTPLTADFYLEPMRDHVLTAIVEAERVKCYRCGKPGDGNYSFYVTFTPAGICIQGDITPERNGSVSSRGYGVDWFAGELSEGYLCEKFLTRKYTAELAEIHLTDPRHWIRQGTNGKPIAAEGAAVLDRLAGQVHDHGDEGRWLYDELLDEGFPVDDGCPGWGYAPQERTVLVAIQRKFGELYRARVTGGGKVLDGTANAEELAALGVALGVAAHGKGA